MGLTRKAAFYTLGCKVNQYETENIKKQFLERGYEEENFENCADVYIINSCTVTNLADRKTRNMLRRAKSLNPESTVVATGCYAQTNAEDIARIPEVDYIIGNSDKKRIAEIVIAKTENKINVKNIFEESEYQENGFTTLREMTRAYIKIQDGCDNFCSYCKIPFARGKKRSRNPEKIIDEVRELVKEGYSEIILIGINLGAYGEDFENKVTLDEIIDKVSLENGVKRVRIGSIYPDKISDNLIELMAKRENIMPHLHISMQSGSDRILKLMKRKYCKSDIKRVFDKIRKKIPDIEFTCDIITGFPGERDEDFEEGAEFIESLKFSNVHIFQYSDRENTEASKMAEKVEPKIKKERSEKLEIRVNKIGEEIRKSYIDKKVKLLVEEIEENFSYGYSENYIRIKSEETDVKPGDILQVIVKKVEKGMLIGGKKNI